MQIDMHYYGTYCLARAAGLDEKTAFTIAYAAQFVDDNASKETIEFKDAGSVQMAATAHHTIDWHNIHPADQRLVWVPFHFLPGAKGNNFTHRLVCKQAGQSKIAEAVLQDALDSAAKPYAEARIGITAHVLADTYSHYGFSGVGSRHNKVQNIKLENVEGKIKLYVEQKKDAFFSNFTTTWRNIKSFAAETAGIFSHGALGHGAVATLPDRPFLIWSFEYEHNPGTTVTRDNPTSYLEGCRHLHSFFSDFANKRSDLKNGGVEFSAIEATVKDIITTQKPKQGHINAWRHAASNGSILDGVQFEIPDYNKNKWGDKIEHLQWQHDSKVALEEPVYNFFRAARAHRAFLLRDLLPDHELVVA